MLITRVKLSSRLLRVPSRLRSQFFVATTVLTQGLRMHMLIGDEK